MTKEKRRFRSTDWFGRKDKDGFIHRSWMKNQGFPDDVFDGRPVIGICNTWSELNPCNAHLRDLAERVKRGVWEAGGLPLEFPVTSTGEAHMRPTAMLFRNLVSMDVEEASAPTPSMAWCFCAAATRPPQRSSWARPVAMYQPSLSLVGRCSTANSTEKISAPAPTSGDSVKR